VGERVADLTDFADNMQAFDHNKTVINNQKLNALRATNSGVKAVDE